MLLCIKRHQASPFGIAPWVLNQGRAAGFCTRSLRFSLQPPCCQLIIVWRTPRDTLKGLLHPNYSTICATFRSEHQIISVQKQVSRISTAFTYCHVASNWFVIPSGFTMCMMLHMQSIHEQTMTQDLSVVEPIHSKKFSLWILQKLQKFIYYYKITNLATNAFLLWYCD